MAESTLVPQLSQVAGEVDSLPLSRLAALCRSIGEGVEGLASSRDEPALQTALAVLQRCEALIDSEGVFSSNEGADDLATSDLHMLLVAFTHGELLCSCPAKQGPPQRLRMVQGALAAHARFLHRLEQYDLLGELAARQYSQQEEEQNAVAAAAGASTSSGCSSSSIVPGGMAAQGMVMMGGGGNVAARRQAKIDRFKRERQLASQLDEIRKRKEAARGRQQAAEGDGEGDDETELGGPTGWDEEEERRLWLLKLESSALKALEQRVALFEEQQLLVMAIRAQAEAPTDPASRAREQRRQEEEARQRAMVMMGLQNVAGQLAAASARSNGSAPAATGGGAGAGASAMAMLGAPVVTAPASTGITAASAQVSALGFGVQAERERARQGVFRPSHTMPTMTVEQFGRLEMQEAMQREQAEKAAKDARAAKDRAASDGNEFEDEAELQKQREWDDWKDFNKAGSGNSALRPCGR